MKKLLQSYAAVCLLALSLIATAQQANTQAAQKKSGSVTNVNRQKTVKPAKSKPRNNPNSSRRGRMSNSCCGGGGR